MVVLDKAEEKTLKLVCEAYTNDEIAKKLEYKPNYVKKIMERLIKKCGIGGTVSLNYTRIKLIVFAYKNKLIN